MWATFLNNFESLVKVRDNLLKESNKPEFMVVGCLSNIRTILVISKSLIPKTNSFKLLYMSDNLATEKLSIVDHNPKFNLKHQLMAEMHQIMWWEINTYKRIHSK